MKFFSSATLTLLAACFAGPDAKATAVGCVIEGPIHLMPEKVGRVRLGMSKSELERILGQVDYSPAQGQFYFTTGGDCPLEGAGRAASCGLIAEFRNYRSHGDAVLTDSLQSCRWGAIGE